ncbi:MAG: medium chain dehydrogenase/reductase family protein [Myxococcota bacterium]
MRRVVVHRPGGYARLVVEDAPDVVPREGEVTIDVEAAGVNYADCMVRMGLYASARKYVGWPITPGFEVAGRVRAVGAGTTGFSVGEEVFAVTRFGGYASQLCVPAHQVFRPPRGWTAVQAAGFPTVFLTAYHALFHLAHARRDDVILVHSAAGGVGGALVQLGKLRGCRVVGVVGGTHKVEAVRELGAHHVIDKSREDLWSAARRQAPEGYDVVLDANGVSTLRESFNHLRPTGRLVVYGFHSMIPRRGGKPDWLKLAWDWLRTPRFNPLDMTGTNRSVMAFNLSYLFERADLLDEAMRDLMRWVDEGKIHPLKVTTYPLASVADAHRDLESGKTVGKLVLVT